MVSRWIDNPDSGRRVDDGYLKYSDGGTFDLSRIQGGSWTRQKLDRLNKAIQADWDIREPILSLPVDDIDRTKWEADPVAASARLFSLYGGRVFYDGTDLVTRNTTISFTIRNGELVPYQRVTR